MTRVLVTGMSGTGKTTLLGVLRDRGYLAIDTDYNGWELPDGTWDEPRMAELLADHHTLVVSGTVANQGRFYRQFDHVVLLSAPLDVLLERVAKRTDNPYGKTLEHRDEIARYLEETEPLLRRGAGTELDGRRPVSELADCVQALLDEAPDLPANRTELNSSG
ncbi:MAG: AAA family ATPase [Nakamurella sp.]